MSGRCHVADLGPVRVVVTGGYARLEGYLGEFYRLVPGGGPGAEWTIEARLAVPEPGMALTRGGVGCRADRAPGQTAELWPFVRFDWMFTPALNTRHLPRPSRGHATFVRDTASRLSELGAISRVTRWRHRGHIAPLLRRLADLEGPP